ncbi:hypothetical protein WA026_003366 [Henosepilachna vigintioctopunctata]|uniref:Uncharacterized protein n=1 Tax=Henosepilachna vigintioctopunctata TaxID=420089 RepID=A0AAW1TJD9_9CUCU
MGGLEGDPGGDGYGGLRGGHRGGGGFRGRGGPGRGASFGSGRGGPGGLKGAGRRGMGMEDKLIQHL